MSKQSDALHRDYTYDNTLRWTVNPDEELLRAMASGILSQAVEDWIGLIRCEEKFKAVIDPYKRAEARQYLCGTSNYTEIRNFFHSDWGDTICGLIDLEPNVILRRLEKWLIDYREDGVIPRHIHRISDKRKEDPTCSTRKTSTAN